MQSSASAHVGDGRFGPGQSTDDHRMNDTQKHRARYTARFELLEEPKILEQLEQRAIRNGGSVAAEIRRAVRQSLEQRNG
jgi:hypothetical protein